MTAQFQVVRQRRWRGRCLNLNIDPAAIKFEISHVAPSPGATFPLPSDGGTIVGRVHVVTDIGKNTLLDIARRYDLGYEEIVAANPGTSVWLPRVDARIVVPTEFVLPPRLWVGIVINVAQRRLYYFPEPKKGEAAVVVTFPVGIARPGWPTPLGRTRIIGKFRDPSWIVPKSIQEEHRRDGESRFPIYFPPGPDNPMGMLAMQTGFRGIFIHGTNRPWGVGMRVSHGCLHLYPEDAAELFEHLRKSTPVRIVSEPYVVGLRNGEVYMASFEPIDDYPNAESRLTRAVAAVSRILRDERGEDSRPAVNWDRVLAVARTPRPIPISLNATTRELNHEVAAITAERYRYSPYGTDANDARPPKEN